MLCTATGYCPPPNAISPFTACSKNRLDHQALDLLLDVADLGGEVAGFVCGDGGRDDGAADTAGTAQGD